MKFSETWLREWVNPDVDTRTLAHQLTMAGLEVDGLHAPAGAFNSVVIGKIQHAEQHPKADRLRVCQVDVGQDALLNIVCGAPNARAGIYVAVAMIGAVLPNGMAIQHAELRGVASEGMLCSAQELGLSESTEGIIELPDDAPLGQDLRTYWDLNDTIFELSITPNRGDCLSILGIAREVSALNLCDINNPLLALKPVPESIEDVKIIHVENNEHCSAYYGRVIKNIQQSSKTPRWIGDRVKRAGTRLISPTVDITNFILNELGQPLHAFDLDTLQGDIQVRLAKDGETIVLLDEQTITLKSNTLVIADDGGPIAIAGIMGGLRTCVTDKTHHIFLESAWFSPEIIVGRARQYGLSTDAAYRYERHVDPTLQQKALIRASHLMLDVCGGDAGPECVASGKIPPSPPLQRGGQVELRFSAIQRLLGISLDLNDLEMLKKRFKALDLAVEESNQQWSVRIPAHRSDITIEADLVEEVARMYGYEHISASYLTATLQAQPQPEHKISAEKFADTLVARGYHEIISYSFVNAARQVLLYPESDAVTLVNPISSEYTEMRKGLWPGLIEAACYNQNRQITDLRLFEIGTRFILNDNGDLEQKNMLGGLIMGNVSAIDWTTLERAVDFYDLKGDVEALFNLSHYHNSHCRFETARHLALHPGQTAQIFSNDTCLGWMGALHPELIKQWNLIGPVFLFELDLNALSKNQLVQYKKLSKFPAIRRDISFTVNTNICVTAFLDNIRQTVLQYDSTIMNTAKIFDVYKDSRAIAITLQHPERTLVDAEINALMEKVIEQLQSDFGIVLRQ